MAFLMSLKIVIYLYYVNQRESTYNEMIYSSMKRNKESNRNNDSDGYDDDFNLSDDEI